MARVVSQAMHLLAFNDTGFNGVLSLSGQNERLFLRIVDYPSANWPSPSSSTKVWNNKGL
ncbi:MAG: hypothetical protein ACYSUY_06860 [Planctomycetota bacterium]